MSSWVLNFEFRGWGLGGWVTLMGAVLMLVDYFRPAAPDRFFRDYLEFWDFMWKEGRAIGVVVLMLVEVPLLVVAEAATQAAPRALVALSLLPALGPPERALLWLWLVASVAVSVAATALAAYPIVAGLAALCARIGRDGNPVHGAGVLLAVAGLLIFLLSRC